jgi:hypothetical protein
MTLGARLDELLSRRRTENIRRRDHSLAVWDVGQPGLFARLRRERKQAIEACRAELMSCLLSAGGPVFVTHHEPPAEYDVPGEWQPMNEHTWLVPSDFNGHDPASRRWLSLGDWCFYAAPAPAPGTSRPDAFRCTAAELLNWMSEQSVEAMIESFHDDYTWVVAASDARSEPGLPSEV